MSNYATYPADREPGKCNHSGGVGIGAGHECVCADHPGHEAEPGDLGHKCRCGAIWANQAADHVEAESFAHHSDWLGNIGEKRDVLDALAEMLTGVPDIDELTNRADSEVQRHEHEAARWRGIARAARTRSGGDR